MSKTIKKYMLFVLGSFSLALGFIGVFLPVLPTTPFLLLSVYCYLRSSEKLYQWLINNRILGAYIYNYMTYRAILISTKVYTIIILWLSLTASMIIISSWWIRLILILVGIGVSIHVLTLKTIRKSELKKPVFSGKINEK